jgi:hypothetical protein
MHSYLILTPDNQAAYANNPLFQNIDANGNRFATIGAGPNWYWFLEAGINRDHDIHDPINYRQKLQLPCRYKNEDEAIATLIGLAIKYNDNKTYYEILPFRLFGLASGFNSNSFIAGLGLEAGFALPAYGSTGGSTPGYQNPIPSFHFEHPP